MPLASGFDHSFDYSDTDRHFLPAASSPRTTSRCAGERREGYYASTAIADHAIANCEITREQHAGPALLSIPGLHRAALSRAGAREDIARYRDRYLRAGTRCGSSAGSG